MNNLGYLVGKFHITTVGGGQAFQKTSIPTGITSNIGNAINGRGQDFSSST